LNELKKGQNFKFFVVGIIFFITNEILIFEKKIFSYAGQVSEMSQHSLRGVGQPSSHFVGQMQDGPMRGKPAALPSLVHIKKLSLLQKRIEMSDLP